jgi:uncharacterized protein DUF4136
MTSRLAWVGLVSLLAVGCSTIPAHHNLDPSAPFTTYQTFAWVTEEPLIKPGAGAMPGGVPVDPLLDPTIRGAVERNMAEKGYQQTRDPATADLVLSYSIGARDKIDVDSYPVGAGYRYGGAWGYGYATQVDTYTEGTLALDFFDGHTKRAVWHGYATKRLSSYPTPEGKQKNINLAADSILKEFPTRGATPPPAD